MPTVGLIPVFNKGEVSAWSIVDEDTFLWIKMRRWHLIEGYAAYATRLLPNPNSNQRKPVRMFMHRELMRLGYGDKRVVDHINGDKLDNRLANLRVLTVTEHGQNKPSYKGSSSQYRGVDWYPPRGQWRVQIMVGGKSTLVGYFDDEDEAGAAAEVFYEANVPYRRQELTTAVDRPRVSNSGLVEPHLVTVTTTQKEVS